MTRVALYIRVSTEEQALHGLSVEAQTNALDAWAKQNKAKVIDHYIDAGISARKKAIKRPELQRLLDDVRAGKIDLIVFTKLDRWFRNVSEYYKVQDVLEQYHIDWKTIHEDYDTTTASGRLKINIMLSVAQDEADRTSERIKVVFDGKRSRNEPLNGKAPRGYKIINKQVLIDEETAPLVRSAFKAYMETGAINKMISAAPGLRLHYQSARAMLQSTAYIGDWCGISVEPILSKIEYSRIQNMQKKNIRKTRENRTYLFSGIAFCTECGRRMGARSCKRRHMQTVYYICPGHYQFKGCQNATNFREDRIEQYLLDHADQKLEIAMNDKRRLVLPDYEKERIAVKRKLSKLSELYVNEMIELDDYKRQYKDLTVQLEGIPDNQPVSDLVDVQSRLFEGWKDVYSDLKRPEKQEFWRLTVKEIRLFKDGRIDFEILD